MKPYATIVMLVLGICTSTQAQTKPSTLPRDLFDSFPFKPDVRAFELAPVAPPVPAMKYQLRFDDPLDRREGNAAVLYLDAIILMGRAAPDGGMKGPDAMNAFVVGDMKTFDRLADELAAPDVFKELDLAGRMEECDWEVPFRDMGIESLLPHLSDLRYVDELAIVRAFREMEQGNIDEAVRTLRLGYELCDKMGRSPFMVSGLVSRTSTILLNDTLSLLMNRPDAPNLYWAMSAPPNSREILYQAYEGECSWVRTIPNLTRALAGEEISHDQWQQVFDYLNNLIARGKSADAPPPERIDPLRQSRPNLFAAARDHYAQSHRDATDAQVALADPLVVIGEFYLWQYQVLSDDFVKLRGLPYPILLARGKQYTDRVDAVRKDEPANLFFRTVPQKPTLAIWTFAWTDRQWAGLTAVEAIRSYAAANGGKLPARLQDVTETPVPINPATDQPFEYKVVGDVAVLSDLQSETPLTYTIRIRRGR